MKLKLLVLTLLLTTGFLSAKADKYSVKKGNTITVNCTATAPAGYITHAFYNFTDPEDAEYLGISFTSSERKATFYGLKAKSNIKIEVTYAYSYRGSYDNDMHVGHGTYYDYITVTGAPDATRVEFKEGSEIVLRPGQSVTVHTEFYPKGSEGWCDFGFVSGFGQPFNFSCVPSEDGTEAVITAKKEGYVYLVAMLFGKQSNVATMTVKCSENASPVLPESIRITPSENVKMVEGSDLKLGIAFSPSNAFASVEWFSSDEKVLKVDGNGNVTAIGSGSASITATSENGHQSTIDIKVVPVAKSVSLPASAKVNLGYSFKLTPKLSPADGVATISWSSSDKTVATVSSNGVVTGKMEGMVTITAKCKELGLEQKVEIEVKHPKDVMDYRSAKTRIQAIKHLFNSTVISGK